MALSHQQLGLPALPLTDLAWGSTCLWATGPFLEWGRWSISGASRGAHLDDLIPLLEYDPPRLSNLLGSLGVHRPSTGQVRDPLGHMWGEAATGSKEENSPQISTICYLFCAPNALESLTHGILRTALKLRWGLEGCSLIIRI